MNDTINYDTVGRIIFRGEEMYECSAASVRTRIG
jgi:hypothetical protein